MEKKIIGIFVCTLLIIAAVLPVAGTMNVSKSQEEEITSESDSSQSSNPITPNPTYRPKPRPLVLPPWLMAIFNNDWDYWTNPPNMFTIPLGNVGIGTSNPENKLDVRNDVIGDMAVIYAESISSDLDASPAIHGRCVNSARGVGGDFIGGRTGVRGEANTLSGSGFYYGVKGYASGGTGENFGVYGLAHSCPESYGGYFESDEYGVYAISDNPGDNIYRYGGKFEATDSYLGSGINYGVYSEAYGTSTNIGGYFRGDWWAGYFEGDVGVTGDIYKGACYFKIDHPLDPTNKYLIHSCVESPDMMNIYNDVVVLDENGEATIILPEYFEALNKDFRYQLTCIGGYAPVYIAEEISNNQFKIAGGKSNMKVSWEVTGIRQDPYAIENPISVEEYKSDNERGKYLHPKAYGMSDSMGINYREK
jgi:hypothetical protein